MRFKLFQCSLLFVATVVWAGSDPLKDFSHELSKKQKVLLQDFFQTLVSSSAGYVIYGDAPMSIETCEAPSVRFFSSPKPETVFLMKGKEFWEDLRLPVDDKEYVLTAHQDLRQDKSKYHFVCINRKAFLNTVQENLPLFQYALGPTVTPDGLLQAFSSSSQWFYTVLNENPVLVEILLGHGKRNAIVNGRVQYLNNPALAGAQDEFPFISKKLSKVWAASANKYQTRPSFGFQSVAEEENALAKFVVSSDKLKIRSASESGVFYCLPETDETKSILASHEKTRAAVAKVLAKKDFLEDTLRKFFTTTAHGLVIPAVPKIRDLSLPANKAETVARLVDIIYRKIGQEPHAAQKFQNAFLQGVAAREKKKQMPVPITMRRTSDIPTLERELECCKNLERANAYFAKLSDRPDLTVLVPNELYMKVLKSGQDKTISSKTQKVSFQYTYQILGDDASRDWGIVKNENVAALIPGVAAGLIGMQLGEERVLYIHPKYAYGENTFLPPNASIVAQVRLLEFEDGETNLAFLPPHAIEQRDYRELLTKFEVLRGEEFFDQGVEFWDSIKKGGDYVDFDTFRDMFLKQASGAPTTLNESSSEQFIVDLEYLLMSQQNPV